MGKMYFSYINTNIGIFNSSKSKQLVDDIDCIHGIKQKKKGQEMNNNKSVTLEKRN